MTKPNRPIAFAALLLACVLLSAGFFVHGHDDDPGSHDHDCITCCLPHYAALSAAAAPTPSTPELAACAAEATKPGDARGVALGTPLKRGPPV